MFTFNVDVISELKMKVNHIALQPLYLKSTFAFVFLKWKYILYFTSQLKSPVNISSQTQLRQSKPQICQSNVQ